MKKFRTVALALLIVLFFGGLYSYLGNSCSDFWDCIDTADENYEDALEDCEGILEDALQFCEGMATPKAKAICGTAAWAAYGCCVGAAAGVHTISEAACCETFLDSLGVEFQDDFCGYWDVCVAHVAP